MLPAVTFLPLAGGVLRVLPLELAPPSHVEILHLLRIEVESICRFYVGVVSLFLAVVFECHQAVVLLFDERFQILDKHSDIVLVIVVVAEWGLSVLWGLLSVPACIKEMGMLN
jgi:hypothetical protein